MNPNVNVTLSMWDFVCRLDQDIVIGNATGTLRDMLVSRRALTEQAYEKVDFIAQQDIERRPMNTGAYSREGKIKREETSDTSRTRERESSRERAREREKVSE
jgi:hypothetical protein